MAHRLLHVALTALLVSLLAVALVTGRNGAPAETSGRAPIADLQVSGPATVLRGEEATFTATSEQGDVSTVVWRARGEQVDSGAGDTFSVGTDVIGEIEVVAELPSDYGRVRRVTLTLTVEANPLDDDDDGDGLDNRREAALGTSPTDSDTDGDGLGDADEVGLGTDPTSGDTDGDLLPDAYELAFRMEPLVGTSAVDTDGDGHPDIDEFRAGTNPRNDRFHPDGPEPTAFSSSAVVGVGSTGIDLTFRDAGATVSRTAVTPWTGLWYAEATAVGEEPIRFGLTESRDDAVAADEPALAVDVAPGATVGLIVDARTDRLAAWPVTEDADGVPTVGERVEAGPFGEVALSVSGPAGAEAVVNAGDDPYLTPFEFGAHYLLYNAGEPAAEFMSMGWGPVNEYRGREVPEVVDTVRLIVDDDTGHGVQVSGSGRLVSYDPNDDGKQAVIANQGMIGEFRYWEATRLWSAPIGLGQGVLTQYSILDPYPGALGDPEPSQPGMSVNSLQNVWQYPVAVAGYDTSNTTYGFAVDYRSDRPIVHVIIGEELITSIELDVFVPVFPALYGTPGQSGWIQEANFGTEPFVYDAAAILGDAGIDTTGFALGWGVHEGTLYDAPAIGDRS